MIESVKYLTVQSDSSYRYKEFTGSGAGLWWSGQVGFIIKFNCVTMLTGLYLFDVPAEK